MNLDSQEPQIMLVETLECLQWVAPQGNFLEIFRLYKHYNGFIGKPRKDNLWKFNSLEPRIMLAETETMEALECLHRVAPQGKFL